MTLVIAHADGDIGFMVGDTLLSHEHFRLKDDIGPVNGEFHSLKIQILSGSVAVAFAGSFEAAYQAVRDLKDALSVHPDMDPVVWLAQRDGLNGCAFLVLLSAITATVPAHPTKGSIEDELRALGQMLARSLVAPDGLALYRVIVAEAGRLPALGAIFYEHGPRLARNMAAKILVKRFDELTAAARASTFVALVIGDVHLEMTLGYEVLDFKARFKKQVEEAIQASLR